jgi:NDP-sugar pyrophosphorylase family protein
MRGSAAGQRTPRELMDAIILAGGKAERLGDAAQGKPKSLVRVAGHPLVAYQIGRLRKAGVERVIISCAAGQEDAFAAELTGLGVEIVTAGEPERLGRGGGIRFAAGSCRSTEELYALNGDELIDVDLRGLLLRHRETGAVATIAVAQPPSPFGVVDVGEDDVVTGFRESGRTPYWVNCGVYVLGREALGRFPERGDHETTAFPELAAEGKLFAFRHEGLWLTVNTPKDLRRAEEYVGAHPEWLG